MVKVHSHLKEVVGVPSWFCSRPMLQWQLYRHDIRKMLTGNGGLVSYLNTNDAREVEAMIEKRVDKKVELVYEAQWLTR